MFAETRKVAEEIVASIRIGKYDECAEFTLTGNGASAEHERQLISLMASGVCANINDILNDEKLSYWLKSNYQFVAVISEKKGNTVTISCGFLKNSDKKDVKKMAKESNGNIKFSQLCDHCFKESPSLQKCGGCRSVSYCCKEHQTADWKKHKVECKSLQEAKL
jgi:hypothetical protein